MIECFPGYCTAKSKNVLNKETKTHIYIVKKCGMKYLHKIRCSSLRIFYNRGVLKSYNSLNGSS